MITERTLRQWRRDALSSRNDAPSKVIETHPEVVDISLLRYLELQERILRLTQELLDQNLLRRKS